MIRQFKKQILSYYMRWILAVLIIPFIGAVQISQLYYDAGNEAGSEYIILFNTEDKAVSLDDWTISTPISDHDATITGSIEANSSFIIADDNWDDKKDNASWPDADYKETITMPNNDGYVQLIDNEGKIVDTLGYGDTQVYNIEPHPGAEENEALVRINNTGNNKLDFISSQPQFTSDSEDEKTIIEVIVADYPAKITAISVEDDIPEQEGIQIIPVLDGSRNITVNVTVTDENIQGYSLHINNEEIMINHSNITQTYSVIVPVNSATNNISVIVNDSNTSDEVIIPITILDVTGIKIPDIIIH